VNPIADHWRTDEAEFRAGDLVLAYSDGLLEAADGDGVPFEVEGVTTVVEAMPSVDRRPTAVVSALIDALTAHIGSRQPRDDVTIVCAVNARRPD